VVPNTPEVLSFATAECAFTLMLMAARRAEGERMVRAGKWEGWAPTQLLDVTVGSKKLGIRGFGRIGRELAGVARGFRMEIHYRDLNRLPPEQEQGAIFHENDDDFLRAIDVLSMHVPGREETRKWLNAARLVTMKRGAVVVNTGRGASVDDEALIAALKSGHIRAAGLDVYDGEPNVKLSHAGECRPAAASRQRHHRDARCDRAPGTGEPGCGAAEGYSPTASRGPNEQGPGASGARPDFRRERTVIKMDYEAFFKQCLNELRTDGRIALL
jgi:lactate dehydrogenase-like 2-hydroxyacid dehydrogenase